MVTLTVQYQFLLALQKAPGTLMKGFPNGAGKIMNKSA